MLNHVVPRRKSKTVKDYRAWLDHHVLPTLGTKKIPDVLPRDIERLVRSLKDRPTTANRVLAVLSSMFTYAIRDHQLRDNPARGIERYEERKHKRYLKPEELGRLGEVLAKAEMQGDNRAGIDAIRLLLLTGMRRGEVETLRWAFIDFDQSAISLPDSKSGEKTLSLGDPAVELLKAIRLRQMDRGVFREDGFVIPGQSGHLVGLPKMWRKWRSAAQLEDVRIHDLRHSWASVGASSGTSLFVLGAVLGHKSSATTERYAPP